MLVWMDGKGPGEDANFNLDWTTRLNGDTITSSTWEVVGTDPATPESPIALEIMTDSGHQASVTGAVTQVWLSGGTLGITYVLQNIVDTANGDQPLTEMIQLPMRNR